MDLHLIYQASFLQTQIQSTPPTEITNSLGVESNATYAFTVNHNAADDDVKLSSGFVGKIHFD